MLTLLDKLLTELNIDTANFDAAPYAKARILQRLSQTMPEYDVNQPYYGYVSSHLLINKPEISPTTYHTTTIIINRVLIRHVRACVFSDETMRVLDEMKRDFLRTDRPPHFPQPRRFPFGDSSS
jgi:hypothetical protein